MALSASNIVTLLKTETGKKHDGEGLYLDIRSPTSASWLFKFRFAGKPEELGLGKLAAKSGDRDEQVAALQVELDVIRARADFFRAELLAGRNPKATKKAIKVEAIRVATRPKSLPIHELLKQNFARINGGKVKKDEGREDWIESLKESRIGRIATMQPDEVTQADCILLMNDYGARSPWQASFALYRLWRTLDWARTVGLIETAGWENPAKWDGNLEYLCDVQLPKTSDSVPYKSLVHQEVGGFLAKLRALDGNSKEAVACMEWQIISGSRPSEAEGADWSEINLMLKAWVIPAERMKMKLQHRVPLTDRHVEILESLLPANGEMPVSGLIFPGVDGGELNRAGRQKMLRKLCDKTLHGFRSSFSTWAHAQMRTVIDAETGEKTQVPRWAFETIEECIAHVTGSKSSRIYNRDDKLEARRPIMAAWVAYCAVVQEAATVVELGRLRRAA